MASNFRFTGAPKPAMYTPRSVEHFLALPTMRAKVKQAAIQANEMATIDTTGLDQKDLPMAMEMTNTLNTAHDKNVDFLLSDESVTTASVNNIVKNLQHKKEVQKKINIGLNNAQAKREYYGKLDDLGLRTGDYEYYGRVKEANEAAWQGSWNPDGTENTFTPTNAPKNINIKEYYDSRLKVAMQNMTPEERANVSIEDLEIIPVQMDGGTQMVYKMKGGVDKYSNSPALNNLKNNFLNEINDPSTEIGSLMQFMGPEWATRQVNSLQTLDQDYMRMTEKASQEQIKLGGFQKAEAPTPTMKEQLRAGTTLGKSSEVFLESHSKISDVELDESGAKPAAGKYIKDYDTAVANMTGIEGDVTVGQMASILSGGGGFDQNLMNPFVEWVSSTVKPGTKGYRFAGNTRILMRKMDELRKLTGNDASFLADGDFLVNEDGTGSVSNPKVHELKQEVMEGLIDLQHFYTDSTQKAAQRYYSNPLTILDSNGKPKPVEDEVLGELKNHISGNLLIRAELEGGKYTNVTHNMGQNSEGMDLEQKYMTKLNNYGKSPNEEGEGGGFMTNPKVTSIDGRDVVPDWYSGGKVPGGKGVDAQLNDMAIFETVEDGKRVVYMQANQGTIPTPAHTKVNFSNKNGQQTGSIVQAISNTDVGETTYVGTKSGPVSIKRTEVGYTVRGTGFGTKHYPTLFEATDFVANKINK
jgi:hypothetical protein